MRVFSFYCNNNAVFTTHFIKSITSLLCRPTAITFLIFLVLCGTSRAVNGDLGGGDGQESTPYLIEDLSDFQEYCSDSNYWASGKYTQLETDLDLSQAGSYTASPITTFAGNFDGNGNTISNLSINGDDNLGLFGDITQEGTVINISVVNVDIVGGYRSYYLGSVCGRNLGNIINSCSTGSVTGGHPSYEIGGLCGENRGTIANSYTSVSVSCSNDSSNIGGLCGQNNSKINNCFSNGSVSGNWNCDKLGGLCGRNSQGTITNCYSTAIVTAGNYCDYVGGLCGLDNNVINNSFWDIETTGTSNSDGGTGKSTEEMQVIGTFVNAGWDFVGETANGTDDIWRMDADGVDYPRLAWEFETNLTVIPVVAGLTQTEAENTITADGLSVGQIKEEFSKTVPARQMIRSEPAAGTEVEAGSTVDLVVSLGTLEIPSLPTESGSIVTWVSNSSSIPFTAPGAVAHDYVDLSCGNDHAVALRQDGSLVAWGSPSQTNVPAGYDYVGISAGSYHSIALKTDGSVVVWGGSGSEAPYIPTGTDYVAVAAGNNVNYLLKSDGSIVGWDLSGQSIPVASGNDFTAISTSSMQTLALKADGSVVSWDSAGTLQSTPSGTFSMICAGGMKSLAIKTDGSIVEWESTGTINPNVPSGNDYVSVSDGYNAFYAVKSDGSVVSWRSDGMEAAEAPAWNDYVAVSGGYYYGAGLREDGSIVTWVSNSSSIPFTAPGAVAHDYVDLSCGNDHAVALRQDGSLVAWGSPSQTNVPAGYDYVGISAGSYHSIALKTDGSVVVWGGSGSEAPYIPTGTDYVAVAAGNNVNYLLKSDGSIVGWDLSGQSIPVASGNDFTAISTSSMQTLALKADGSVVSWDSAGTLQSTPSGTFSMICAGGMKSLAIKTDGSIVEWESTGTINPNVPSGNDYVSVSDGYNAFYAVKSDGSVVSWRSDGMEAAEAPAWNDYVAVSGGYYYGAGLREDGSIVTWVSNSSSIPFTAPGAVAHDYVDLSCGNDHAVALRQDGSLVAWGSPSQTNVPAGYDYVGISAGSYHSIALKTDGSVVVWGGSGSEAPYIPTGTDYVAVAAGNNVNYLLKSDGSIVGWDLSGQSIPVASGNDFTAISTSSMQTLALKADGSVVSWDSAGTLQSTPSGTFSMICAGGMKSLAIKTDGSIVEWESTGTINPNVPSGNDYVSVSDGYNAFYAVKSDGSVVSWRSDGMEAAEAPAWNDYVAVSGGYYYGAGLRNDGNTPKITATSIKSAFQGDSVTINVTAENTHFTENNELLNSYLSMGAATIQADNIAVVDDNNLQVTFHVPLNAEAGRWDLFLDSPQDGLLPHLRSFVVIAAHPPVVQSDSTSIHMNTIINDQVSVMDPDGDSFTVMLNSDVSHGTLSLNPDGSYSYTTDDGYAGPDSFTYNAIDSRGMTSANATVTISVTNLLPTIAGDLGSNHMNHEISGLNLSDFATDADADPIAVISGVYSSAMGGTLTFDGANWTYTPDEGYVGPDSFEVEIWDGQYDYIEEIKGEKVTVTGTITVTVTNALPVAEDVAVVGHMNNLLNGTATFFDNPDTNAGGELDTLTIQVTDQPDHGTLIFNSETGEFTYTPIDSGYVGLDSFTYSVSDGQQGVSPAEGTMTLTLTNALPVAGDAAETGHMNTILNGSVTFGDTPDTQANGEIDPVSVSISQQPQHGTVTLDPATGQFTLTPTAGYVGTDQFVYAVSDGQQGSPDATGTVTLTLTNTLPVVQPESVTTHMNTPVMMTLSDNYSDADGDPLTVAVSSPVNGTLIDNGEGTYTYTPSAGYVGPENLTLSVSDGQLGAEPSSAQVSISVTNSLPIVQAEVSTTHMNTPVVINLSDNFSDSDDDPVTLSINTPSNGTLIDNGDQTYTYTPMPGFVGQELYSFTASDGQLGVSAPESTVTVNVTNTLPIANNDQVSVDYGTSEIINVLENDQDPDGDPLTVGIISTPNHGSVTVNPDGTCTYVPNSEYDADDSFIYSISDGQVSAEVISATVDISIVGKPRIATIDDQTVESGTNYQAPVPSLASGTRAPITWELVAGPAGMTIDPLTGTLDWSQAVPRVEAYHITIRATNRIGSDEQSWNLRVLSLPVINSIEDVYLETGLPYQSTQPFLEKPTYAVWSIVEGPAGMAINASNGTVSWNQIPQQHNNYPITIQAENEIGSGTASWNLIVLDAPSLSVMSDAYVRENSTYSSSVPQVLSGGELGLEWELISGPSGLQIDPAKGTVTWPNTVASSNPYTVTAKANNQVGSDEVSWQLMVPYDIIISPVQDQTMASGIAYTKDVHLDRGTLPVQWKLLSGPAGMTINSETGQVSWNSTQASDTPYNITIEASKNYGSLSLSDQTSWHITVMAAPDIQPVTDVQLIEGQSYTFQPILTAGTEPVQWFLLDGPSGMSINTQTGAIAWNYASVSVKPYNVIVRATNSVGSDEESWFISVPVLYEAAVTSNVDLAPANTQMEFSGQAAWIESGLPAAEVDVAVKLDVKGTTRKMLVQTDNDGMFSIPWQPLPNEAGYYTLAASHSAVIDNEPVHDDFTLVGFKTGTTRIYHRIIEGENATGTITIENVGDTGLTGFSAFIETASDDISVTFDQIPSEIPALGSIDINYSITAIKSGTVTGNFVFESTEGAQLTLPLQAMVVSPWPKLEASISSLKSGMVRGKQIPIEFAIANTGGKATSQLDLMLPDVSWLKSASSLTIEPLEPGEISVVTLLLTTDNVLPLGPYSGSIVVAGIDSYLYIPFEFNCISEGKGDLVVRSVDEFTYLGEGEPPVAGASVVLKDPYTYETILEGITDETGQLIVPDLIEAYYDLEVTADDHGKFVTKIFVKAGDTTEIPAFLPRDLVKINWTVQPTTIEDRYVFTVDATFETNVPVPVITIEPIVVNLDEIGDGPVQIDYTITNHGLINAENAMMHLAKLNHPEYSFEPLIDNIGVIPAKSSVTVPVIIRKINIAQQSLVQQASSLDAKFSNTAPDADLVTNTTNTGYYECGTGMRSYVTYEYVCGPAGWQKRAVEHSYRYSKYCPYSFSTGIGGQGAFDIVHFNSGSGNGVEWWHRPGISTPTIWDIGGFGDGESNDIRRIPTYYVEPPKWISGIFCNECTNKWAKTLFGCAWDITGIFWPDEVLEISRCANSVMGSGGKIGIACAGPNKDDCISTAIFSTLQSTVECSEAFPGLGDLIGIGTCAYDLGSSLRCTVDEITEQMPEPRLVQMASVEQNTDNADYLLMQADRLNSIIRPIIYLVGENTWFQQMDEDEAVLVADWFTAFNQCVDQESEQANVISDAESEVLRGLVVPDFVSADSVQNTIDRWNRTMDYWSMGIYNSNDVPEGQNTDFIETGVFEEMAKQSNAAKDENEDEGFYGLLDGIQYSYALLEEELDSPDQGVCVKVKIRIEQEAVISRNAFEATLELGNEGAMPMNNVNVDIIITDENGLAANNLFGVFPPKLRGFTSVAGGTIAAGTTGQAIWNIVPTSEAAPQSETTYYVKGLLTYEMDGETITIPLFPSSITVLPNPNLIVDYFLERDVYSDDPFTEDVIEPAVPYSLGLMMRNTGAGVANDVRVISSQPKIIENEKGLLIDFKIIGSIVGTETVTPSLAVDLGDIQPNGVAVAQWLMESSLQGEFIDYEASYRHLNALDEIELSLVESVSIHEMEHVVRNVYPDDNMPDFLVNGTPDIEDLPDKLYLSDGSVEPVVAITDAVADGVVSSGDMQIQLTVSDMPDGWCYIRVDDPGQNEYQLISVQRSDGQYIMVSDNAWTTHRVIRKVGQSPYDENRLHLFDHGQGGTEVYTLTYAELDSGIPQAVSVVAEDVTDEGGGLYSFEVSYEDDVAMDISTIDSSDIRVTGPHGYSQMARFVSMDAAENTSTVSSLYRIVAPDGRWDYADNGNYTISVVQGQVYDTAGNNIPFTSVGSFNVDIEIDRGVELISFNQVDKRRVGRTEFEYDFTVTLKNLRPWTMYAVTFRIDHLPENVSASDRSVYFEKITAQAAATSADIFTIRTDRSIDFDVSELTWDVLPYFPSDYTLNGRVDMNDFAILSSCWLTSSSIVDIAPEPDGDGVVDILDMAAMMEDWLDDIFSEPQS